MAGKKIRDRRAAGEESSSQSSRASGRGGKGRPPLLDGRGLAVFVAALEQGASVRDAAKAAGFAPNTFYNRRRSCPAFRATWDDAVAASSGPVLVAAQNKRRLQKRRGRRAKFTPERQETFLAHFAATCDTTAAAEEAGISADAVYDLRARDPDFAEAWQAALEQGYARLEAELVRERLEALERLRAWRKATASVPSRGSKGRKKRTEGHGLAGGPPPGCGEDGFERSVKLLQLYKRPSGAIGPRKVRRGQLRRWSFDEAMTRLEKSLRALDIPIVELGEGPLHHPSGGPPPRSGEDR